MSDGSKIEWLARAGTKPATWNPIRAKVWNIQNDGSGKECIGWHCTHVSEGCRNCYAERINLRLGTQRPYRPDELFHEDKVGYRNGEVKVFIDENTLTKPLHWRHPRTIFVCSTSDIFGDWVPDDMIDQVFAIAALCPQHTFIFLTKRAERMRGYLTSNRRAGPSCGMPPLWHIGMTQNDPSWQDTKDWPLPNVWLGVSAENQKTADERIPLLLDTPAAIRFVSCEPMLGQIDLRPYLWASCSFDNPSTFPMMNGPRRNEAIAPAGLLHWVICGGESGPYARPLHPDWARGLRDQCADAGVPFFFKQWGEWLQVGQTLPGYGKIHGATAVKPGRMKLHYSGTPKQGPKYAFAESGVEFSSTDDGLLTFHVGKSAAGDILDGTQHHAWPEVQV